MGASNSDSRRGGLWAIAASSGSFVSAAGGKAFRPDRRRGSHTVGDDDVERLSAQSLHWLVLVSIAIRIMLTVPAVVLNRGVLGEQGDRLVPLAITVLVVDGLLLVAVVRWPQILRNRWVFGVDVVFGIVITVAATLPLARGTYLMPGMDLMTGYGSGTVSLWTTVRGWRVGSALLVGLFLLQLAMAALNGADLDAAGWFNLTARTGFAVMNFGLAAAIVALARRGARLAAAEGLRGGRLAARAEELNAMHDTVLAELESIRLLGERSELPPRDRLDIVSRSITRQVSDLDADRTPPSTQPVLARLQALADLYRERGLQVVVLRGRSQSDAEEPDGPAADAMVGAVREALNNVAKHAQVVRADLTVHRSPRAFAVEVADQGVGFLPGEDRIAHGIRHSLIERMRAVGGGVEIVSNPETGTRVRVRVPVSGEAPSAARVVAEAERHVRWFPLVPLLWRLAALPMAAFMTAPVLVDHLGGLYGWVGVLAVGNLLLVASVVVPRVPDLLSSLWILVVDLGLTAGWFVWCAVHEPPGQVLLPGADGVWTYVIAAAPLWVAVRGEAAGLGVLAGCVGLLYGGVRVNGAELSSGNLILFVHHVALAALPTALALLVTRMARRGVRRVIGEAEFAGRQAEAVERLTGLRQQVLARLEAIRAAAGSTGHGEVSEQEALRTACRLAAGTATELRTALSIGSADLAGDRADREGLVGALSEVVVRARLRGVRVELVVAEYTDDPPDHVVAALAAAVSTLFDDVAGSEVGSAVMRVTGARDHGELSIRLRQSRLSELPPSVGERLRAVGARTHLTPVPGGCRITMSWRSTCG